MLKVPLTISIPEPYHNRTRVFGAVVTTTPLAPFSKLIGEGIENMVKELQDQQDVLQFKNHRSENS